MLFNIIVAAVGLGLSLWLFYRFPYLKKDTGTVDKQRVSIVIPARNEQDNLPLLLGDLKKQTYKPYEIICVDDASTDNTAQIAKQYGAVLISLLSKPDHWLGKSWACQKGAEMAKGELLLFLDADVRMSANALKYLIHTYAEHPCIVSVQPYHRIRKMYEHCSLFFNMILIAANGTSLAMNHKHIGLYGPAILINRRDYEAIGGHACAKSSVIEDLVIGHVLKAQGIDFKLFLGGEDISFRMYAGNWKSLMDGWSKNFAAGAYRTPAWIFCAVFVWIAGCTTVPLHVILSIGKGNLLHIAIWLFVYVLWVLEIMRISRKIGNFALFVIGLYPLPLVAFFSIFTLSVYKGLFRRTVMWKNREITLEK